MSSNVAVCVLTAALASRAPCTRSRSARRRCRTRRLSLCLAGVLLALPPRFTVLPV